MMLSDLDVESKPSKQDGSIGAHDRPRDNRVSVGTATHEALEQLINLIELQLPDMRASIVLLDDDGTTLRTAAAPHLPAAYSRSIDGLQVGPTAGSCGTAIFRNAQVIVSDIGNDPLWSQFKDLALPHGLRACWSTPIRDSDGSTLGSFAMYYSEPRSPSDAELVFTHTATLLAANIIVRAQAEASLHERTVAAEDAAAALVQSEASMRRARAQAEHANQSKADFLAMVSHELRTPLNAIGGYAQLMLDGIPDAATENQQNYLHRILSGQRHILSLIDSVLTHAKLEAGSMSYRMADVRMRDMLDLIEGLLTPQFADKNLSYDCSECDAGIALRGDSEKIAQILLNVVSNAIKFTPPGGSVSISTAAAANNHTRVIVRDTGIGMSASELSIVFEPFVQFDNQLTNRERGTGLGMPISRGLARGMGGDLTATSEPGAGTAFTLTLETAGARIA